MTATAALRRLAAGRGAVSLPVLLLAGVVVLAAVLAYQAQHAARSNLARAEATLRDYSAFAGVEYGRRVRVLVQPLLRLSLQRVPGALDFETPAEDPSAARVGELVEAQRAVVEQGMGCGCLDGVRHYFRIGVADGTLDVAPAASPGPRAPLTPAARAWMRQAVLARLAQLGDSGPPTVRTLGTIDADGRSRDFRVYVSNDTYALAVGDPEGTPRLLAFVLTRDSAGAPVAAYGYESEPAPWLRPVLERALTEEPLLPPALLRDRRNEDVLAVRLRDAEGRELFRSSPRFDDEYAAVDTLADRFGELRLEVAVFPELADALLVGGLPRSRLPMLLALFSLTVGLAVVALRQVRRQQQLARLRSDFVASVSHELRTPLAQIRWFAELLRMGKLRTAEERDRSLRIIDQEARRLAFLVENVLNFSRSSRDTGRVAPEPLVLADEVRDVVDAFQPLAQARRMRVETTLDPALPAMVDRGALRQILLNLLDNAAKYGPVGQTVRVRVAPGDGGRVRLSVEDEGQGVPDAERERVWEPFYRADRDVGTPATGSGIGLSVVNDLVRLQHGRRWVEAGDAGGARFVLEFPAPGTPAGAHPDDPALDGPLPEDGDLARTTDEHATT